MRIDKENITIEDKLSSYIKENCLPKNYSQSVELDRNLFDAGIVDSAGLISFINFVEVEFNFVVPDEDLLPENFATINSITAYIRKRLNEPK